MTMFTTSSCSWEHDVSPAPDLSLKLMRRIPIRRDARIVSIGASSALIAELLREGFGNVAALDACDFARAPSHCALWRDDAFLHTVTDPAERQRYATTLRAALAPDGWVILGGFSPRGASRPASRDAESLSQLLGAPFALRETHGAMRGAPWGGEQIFRCYIFERRGRC